MRINKVIVCIPHAGKHILLNFLTVFMSNRLPVICTSDQTFMDVIKWQ